ncbi:MAG: M20/M25/M40 family metallo-hydrolase [Lentisphaerae bacterium]|jgi:Zn-dependent M28 family amino/carboxypeptidase|nr:M20/M25/M40 family metallo-hydrolase [Lentisphaerota bacterium]
MRLVSVVLALSALFLESAPAGLTPEHEAHAVELREHALGSERAYAFLESLTVEVGPRLAGSPGDARAVAWAEKKLTSLGFDKVWREPVAVRGWERGPAQLRVLSPYPQALHITALGGSVATPVEGIRGVVTIFPDLKALEAASPSQVKDRIVFINARMAATRDGRGYGVVVRGRTHGAAVAGKLGARAVLIRSVGTGTARLPHTGVMQYRKGIPRIPAAALSIPDANQLEAMLRRGDVEVHLGLQSRDLGEATSYNVIGEFRGSTRPEELVLLGAHLDSWDEGTGALDDGFGLAVVAEAARLVGAFRSRPSRTVRVVFYANEENGGKGAKAYVNAHRDEFARHVVAAESDAGGGRIWRVDTRFSKRGADAGDVLSRLLGALGIERGTNQATGGPDISILRQYGVPLVTLAQDATTYFDHHHTADDTLDKVDRAALRQNVAAYVVYVWVLANWEGDLRPVP